MKKCLVSLVSDQTIPNILVAATLRPDYLLFISTDAMEKKKKVESILNCLSILKMDYSNRNDKIIVSENSVPDINEMVVEWIKSKRKEYNFTVNLTCGTKLMSLAVYEVFKGYDAEIIYLPLPKNIYFPVNRPDKTMPVTTRLSVEAYLAAYSVKISNLKTLGKAEKTAFSRRDMTYFIYENYRGLKKLLKAVGEKVRPIKKNEAKKGANLVISYNVKESVEKQFVKKIGFTESNGLLRKVINQTDWDYLRGGWLEDRIYLAVKDILPPESSDIRLKVNCRIHGNDNEFDVLFTFDNILYVIECKSLDAPSGSDKREMGGTANDFLYKLGALRQNFGLTPRGILASTSKNMLDKNGNIKGHLIERSKLFSTEIWPLLQIADLDEWVSDRFIKKR